MEDNRTASEPGSIDNPLGLSDEEREPRWATVLTPGTEKSAAFIEEASRSLLSALELSEKLSAQANSVMMALKMLEKQQKDGSKMGGAEKAKMLIERVHPILTLRELLDVYITNTCEKHLDDLENA